MSTTIENYVIIASLKSESVAELINRIPDSSLLISSLPGSVSRTHVESLGKPCDSTSVLEALPCNLDIKRHSPSILYTLTIVSKAISAIQNICISNSKLLLSSTKHRQSTP